LASQAEKDYEQLEKIVTNLVVFTKSRQPSQVILSEVIKKLASEISERSDQISPYRLRLAYKVDELMKVLSARLIIGSSSVATDSDYRSLANELYSRINLLSSQFNSLLKMRQENANEIYNRGQEISSLTRSVSELHGAVSNYETDLVASRMNADQLRELAQIKQNQIDNLESSISTLEADAQTSRQTNQRQQDQNNYLKNQLSQLKKEKTALQESIQDVTEYIQRQEAELTDVQNEKVQLSLRETEIQRKYRALSQNYQRKKVEISDLNKQLEALSRTNQSKPQFPIHNATKRPIKKMTQPSARPVITKPKISIVEYQKITNQKDYVYVKEHLRKGRLVKAHYRRRSSSP
jgi:chromosome segregation ATPase